MTERRHRNSVASRLGPFTAGFGQFAWANWIDWSAMVVLGAPWGATGSKSANTCVAELESGGRIGHEAVADLGTRRAADRRIAVDLQHAEWAGVHAGSSSANTLHATG